MKPMTSSLRSRIQTHIKEGYDVADLIDGINLRDEDLSGAIISRFLRTNDDLSGCNFSNVIFGKDNGPEIHISSCVMRNVSFKGARVLPKFIFRANDARGSNFIGAFLPYAQWQGSDLRNCKWCGVITCLGSVEMRGARFDQSFFEQLSKAMNLDITVKERKDATTNNRSE